MRSLLLATIYHALGIDPKRENMSGTRPVKIVEGGEVVDRWEVAARDRVIGVA